MSPVLARCKREDGTFFGDLWDHVTHVQAPIMLCRGALSPVVDDADVAEFLRAHGAAEVDGGRLSMSPAAGEEVPETFTNPSPRSAGEASGGAASL